MCVFFCELLLQTAGGEPSTATPSRVQPRPKPLARVGIDPTGGKCVAICALRNGVVLCCFVAVASSLLRPDIEKQRAPRLTAQAKVTVFVSNVCVCVHQKRIGIGEEWNGGQKRG